MATNSLYCQLPSVLSCRQLSAVLSLNHGENTELHHLGKHCKCGYLVLLGRFLITSFSFPKNSLSRRTILVFLSTLASLNIVVNISVQSNCNHQSKPIIIWPNTASHSYCIPYRLFLILDRQQNKLHNDLNGSIFEKLKHFPLQKDPKPTLGCQNIESKDGLEQCLINNLILCLRNTQPTYVTWSDIASNSDMDTLFWCSCGSWEGSVYHVVCKGEKWMYRYIYIDVWVKIF